MRRLFLVTVLAVFPVACSTFDDTGIPEGQGGAYMP